MTRRRLRIIVFIGGFVIAAASAAFGYWLVSTLSDANAYAVAKADTINAGHQPTYGATNGQNVTVSWAASTTVDGQAVTGYTVVRYASAGAGVATPATGGCANVGNVLTCTEQNVTPGDWYYAVTPTIASWSGAESPHASAITVSPPSFSVTSGQAFKTLPATLAGGAISHFQNNESLTFHLDAAAGTLLTASATQVDGTGQAGTPTPFTVTIPTGTAQGSHTVVAVGGNGTQATSNSFFYDATNPVTASVTTPSSGSQLGASGVPASFAGSAADNAGGVGLTANSTTFTLQRPDSTYWTGSTWQASPANLATTHSATSSGTAASWSSSATMPTWSAQPDGTYTVRATATDKAGNTFAGTAVTFTLDNTSPVTASVTAPTSGSSLRSAMVPATFGGSAADNAGGVGLSANSTTFTLQRPDSTYWTGSTWQASPANLATSHSATTSGTAASWSSSATMPTWSAQPDGTYTIRATATDKVGNTLVGSAATFTLDNTNPTSATVTAPTDGSQLRGASVPAIFGGSAADNPSGVGLNANSTTFTLQRSSDSRFWSGSAWQVSATNLATTHSATTSNAPASWTDNVALPSWPTEVDATYTVRATATDKAGNSFAGTAITFVLDNTSPVTASVATPVSGSQFRAASVPVSFGGSAADNSGGVGLNANSTTFTLQRSTDNRFWSGSAWQVAAANLATTHSSTTGNTTASWLSSVTMPTWSAQPDGSYTVTATATDKVGNTFAGSSITFTLDNTNPATASVTSPIPGSPLKAANVPATFSGAAADNAGGVGLSSGSTTFTLQRPDSTYWTGSTWQASPANLATTHGATTSGTAASWTSSVTMPTWSGQPDGVYTIRATATDKVGNTFVGSAATFTLDNTNPTQSLSLNVLSGGAFYNSGTNTIYFRGNAAGSFTLTDTVTDGGSGAASASFPAISTTNWTHGSETVSTPVGGPFTSSTFSWTTTSNVPAPKVIVGSDNAGNTVSTTVTFVLDNAGPTGGALTVNGTAANAGGSSSTNASGSFTIATRTDYNADTSSGLASSILTVQSATTTNNACNAPGTGGPYATATTIVGTTNPAITVGYCYTYKLTGTDNVGNTSSVTTTVRVQGATPTITSAAQTWPKGTQKTFTITGTNFQSGLTVTLANNAGFNIDSFSFVDSTHVSVTITAPSGNNKSADVVITNPDFTTVTQSNGVNSN